MIYYNNGTLQVGTKYGTRKYTDHRFLRYCSSSNLGSGVRSHTRRTDGPDRLSVCDPGNVGIVESDNASH
jgi:hypothetical protein